MRERVLEIFRSPALWLVSLAVFNLAVFYFFVPDYFGLPGDSPSYFRAMEFLKGEYEGDIPYNRLLTAPFVLFSSIFLGFFAGGSENGMIAMNLLFFFGAVFVFYRLAFSVSGERRAALFSGAFFVSNYVFFRFGPTYLADLPGWFFFLLASFLAVRYFDTNERKFFIWSAVLSSVGFLFKEYGGLGVVVLGLLVLLSDLPWRRKIKDIASAGAIFASLPLAYHVYFYFSYGFSYLDWFALNSSYYLPGEKSFSSLVKMLGWLFFAGWPIFLYGLYELWRGGKERNARKMKILIAMAPACLSFLLWPVFAERIAFILVPLLSIVAGLGLSRAKNNTLPIFLIAVYIISNYFIVALIKAVNIPFF